MTARAIIAAATAPEPTTARGIIERRLGRDIGPIRTMPADLRRALYRLALQLQKRSQQ